jgi:D-sedoheptulose 7-phosphate isomerase
MTLNEYLVNASELLLATAKSDLSLAVARAVQTVTDALQSNLPLLVCGNGGSASDAMHITGELVGRFLHERKALPCICLSSNPSVITAWSNDYSYETVFSRQVEAYGRPGGVLLGISTSGNSKNVVAAFLTAKRQGMKTVALTGRGGGQLRELADVLLAVPSTSTPAIQEVHVCLYHYICQRVESNILSLMSPSEAGCAPPLFEYRKAN